MKNKYIYILITSIILFFSSCSSIDSVNTDNWFDFFKSKSDNQKNKLKPYEKRIQQPPLIQFIVDSKDSLNVAYSEHIEKIADYTKIPFATTYINDWNDNPSISPSTRVLCLMETKQINSNTINTILDFVASGGTLFFSQAVTDIRFGYLAGIKATGDFDTDTKSKGIHFTTNFMPGLKGKKIKSKVAHFSLTENNFTPSITVLATAENNPKLPIIIENKIGNGKVIYFNSTFYLEKEDRGLLFAGILNGLDGVPYPIANSSTIFLDDFPSPLYDIKIEPIASEMNLNTADFVTKAWWPDMKKLAEKYNISYTAIPCFDYTTNTEPAFDFSQWEAKKMQSNNTIVSTSSWLMKDCLKNGHELGFHGYNHVSLVKKQWVNPKFMSIAFNTVQKKWIVENFDNFPISYVPPSNIIDETGVKKLRDGMPSLQFMCSLYIGEIENGGGREFDFDPYDPTLFNYPRTSAGFYLSEEKKYIQQSSYLYTGIWSHFVHPDDVYQIAANANESQGKFDLRNGKNLGWRTTKGKKGGLFDEFENYIAEMTQLFPKMRFLNANNGGIVTHQWRASSFKHTQTNENYSVERINKNNKNKQYWFLYGEKSDVAQIDLELKNQNTTFSKTDFQHGFLYTVLSSNGQLVLPNLKQQKMASKEALIILNQKLKQEYNKYYIAYKNFNSENNKYWIDDYELKLQQEITGLKTKMLTENSIDYEVWNKYTNYMSWTNKQDIVWKMLDEKCAQFPIPNNILYSKELEKQIGYPDDYTQGYWLEKQLETFPDDPILLKEYIKTFNTPQNNQKITQTFKKLLRVEPSNSTYLKYIEHILEYEPQMALDELMNIEPNENYKTIAYQISWLFADNKEFKKAYEWSNLSDKITFKSKLHWLNELKEFDEIETQYLIYATKNPNDLEIRALMSNIYHQNNRFKDAWILANTLPESPAKDSLQKMLNKDVVYENEDLKLNLIYNQTELFYPDVKKKIIKEDRLKNGNYIDLASRIETNRNVLALFENILSYTYYGKNKHSNTFSTTLTHYYPIHFSGYEADNIHHTVKGIQYKYKNPFSENKLQYWTSSRLEVDNYNELFFRVGLGANRSKINDFRSAELKFFPTETAAAYTKHIYQLRLNMYQEYYWYKRISTSFSFEGNYYTKNLKDNDVTTDNQWDGSLTIQTLWDKRTNKKIRLLPFLESSLIKGSTTFNNGYPYFILESRFFGGGGLSLRLGNQMSNFKSQLDAAYFLDSFSGNFQRYSSKNSYQLLDYTELTMSFDVFIQSGFYNNNLLFGIKHNFKVKRKK